MTEHNRSEKKTVGAVYAIAQATVKIGAWLTETRATILRSCCTRIIQDRGLSPEVLCAAYHLTLWPSSFQHRALRSKIIQRWTLRACQSALWFGLRVVISNTRFWENCAHSERAWYQIDHSPVSEVVSWPSARARAWLFVSSGQLCPHFQVATLSASISVKLPGNGIPGWYLPGTN
jgi:hypothetical protein